MTKCRVWVLYLLLGATLSLPDNSSCKMDSIDTIFKESHSDFFLKNMIESRELPCPEAEDIAPCTCTVDSNGSIRMDCDEVTSEEQLRSIFEQPFPQSNMTSFYMDQINTTSYITYLDAGVFATKTFEAMTFLNINFNFSLGVFDGMNATLVHLDIRNSTFVSFEKNFNYFTKIIWLHLHDSPIEKFTISSPTLEHLHIFNSSLKEREDGMPYYLGTLSKLTELNIATITTGFLTLMPDTSQYPLMTHLAINDNISRVNPPFQTTSYLDYLSVGHNSLQDIEAGSFTVSYGSTISFEDNQLTDLAEEKWWNLFVNASSIYLADNPWYCGCEMTWIFGRDPENITYLSKMRGYAKCEDGTLFTDLNQTYYEHLC